MKITTLRMVGGVFTLVLAAAGLLLAGCSTPGATQKETSMGAGKKQAVAGANGAQLWAQNCAHCHNVRSPDSYSDAQWDVAMLHMRLRANLTGDEQRQILAFLKSAH